MARQFSRSIGVCALVGLTALSAWSFQPERPARPRDAAPGQPERPRPDRAGGEGRVLSVEAAMKIMNRSARSLKDQIADPAKAEENLRLINDMQRGCVLAKGGTLEHVVENKTDAQKKDITRKFRAQMIELNRTLLDVEQNLLEGKFDAAKAAFAKAGEMQEKYHKEFGVKDEG